MKPINILYILAIALGLAGIIYIISQIPLLLEPLAGLNKAQAADFKIDIVRDEKIKNEVLERVADVGKTIEVYTGEASYYDYDYPKGSGYYPSKVNFTCATRIWPRGSLIEVTNLDTGKKVICKKTDHGPNAKIHPNRIIDLGSKSFMALAPLKQGLIKRVSIRLLNSNK